MKRKRESKFPSVDITQFHHGLIDLLLRPDVAERIPDTISNLYRYFFSLFEQIFENDDNPNKEFSPNSFVICHGIATGNISIFLLNRLFNDLHGEGLVELWRLSDENAPPTSSFSSDEYFNQQKETVNSLFKSCSKIFF
jgi:hypothetical protein